MSDSPDPFITCLVLYGFDRSTRFPKHSLVLSGIPIKNMTHKFEYIICRSDNEKDNNIIEENSVSGNIIGSYPIRAQLKDNDIIFTRVYNLQNVSIIIE